MPYTKKIVGQIIDEHKKIKNPCNWGPLYRNGSKERKKRIFSIFPVKFLKNQVTEKMADSIYKWRPLAHFLQPFGLNAVW